MTPTPPAGVLTAEDAQALATIYDAAILDARDATRGRIVARAVEIRDRLNAIASGAHVVVPAAARAEVVGRVVKEMRAAENICAAAGGRDISISYVNDWADALEAAVSGERSDLAKELDLAGLHAPAQEATPQGQAEPTFHKEMYKRIDFPSIPPCACCGASGAMWEYQPSPNAAFQKVVMCDSGNDSELLIDDECPLVMPPNNYYRATKREALEVWTKWRASLRINPPEQQSRDGGEAQNDYCCHACFRASGRAFLDQMIVCPTCGNKRCPKATDHRLACTDSNEPGQPGSCYPAPQPAAAAQAAAPTERERDAPLIMLPPTAQDLLVHAANLRLAADAICVQAAALSPREQPPAAQGEEPMQPLVIDNDGVTRFKANKIVRYLLDHGGIDMNALAMLDFEQSDREQFAQLIGYSVVGYGELSYVRDSSYERAAASPVSAAEKGKARPAPSQR